MKNRYLIQGSASAFAISLLLIGSIAAAVHSPSTAYAFVIPGIGRAQAPVEVSGDNVYVAWWTNKTGNDEVMFRVSTDAGKTFSDKINLSNSPNSDSVDVSLSEDEGKVAVSWWERNQTSDMPVMRISNNNGKTFGEIIKLSANGPIG